MSINIAEKCGWNLDCIFNSISSLILAYLRGSVSKDLISRSCFLDSAQCTDSECKLTLQVTDDLLKRIIIEYREVLQEALSTLVSSLRPEELVKLLQFFVDNELDFAALQLNSVIDLGKTESSPLVKGQIAEQIGTLLYASGHYLEAASRFQEASKYYSEAGLDDRALFMQAFSKIAEAEHLKDEAARAHEDNKHDVEEELIKRASRLYAESSVLFRQASRTIPEALVNAVLSKSDANEVLANFYFTHGQVEEAEKYYKLCHVDLRQEYVGLTEEYRKLVELKERTCRAFEKLCRAVIEGKSQLYEEAGDEFRRLFQEGYVEDVMVEMATIAYRSAIETAETLDDILRIYPKYIELATAYIDRLVQNKYETFENLLKDIKVRPITTIAKELKVDGYALKMYIAFKLLEQACQELNISRATILDLLTLIAGLNFDPLSTSCDELRDEISRKDLQVNTELLEQMCNLLNKLNEKVRNIILA